MPAGAGEETVMTRPAAPPWLYENGTLFSWTDECVARLRELQARKLSGGEMAKEFGVTRNAVIGKLKRMGLKCESVPAYTGKRAVRRAIPKAPPSTVTRRAKNGYALGNMMARLGAGKPARPSTSQKLSRQAPAEPEILSFEQLTAHAVTLGEAQEGQCRWPLTPTAPISEFRFCGAPVVVAGCSWCSHHCRMAYQLARKSG